MMKAQMHSQVFVYIFAIIVIGLLLLFGYKAIDGLIKGSCKTSELTFRNTLQSMVQDNKAFQASAREELPAPSGCSYATICFADAAAVADASYVLNANVTASFFVKDSVNAHVLRNVFLIDTKGRLDERELYIDTLVVDNGVTCVDASQGVFKVRFIGTGRGTRVESW